MNKKILIGDYRPEDFTNELCLFNRQKVDGDGTYFFDEVTGAHYTGPIFIDSGYISFVYLYENLKNENLLKRNHIFLECNHIDFSVKDLILESILVDGKRLFVSNAF